MCIHWKMQKNGVYKFSIMSKILENAPVLITTLNRADKFKTCIESLERCTGAEKTDVYIALDYPPNEFYRKGWKLIGEYIKNKQQSNNFKSFNILRRTENLGIGHKNSNANKALEELSKYYDRFIFSEDDNIFAPNFLEFLNKGLELFKDDERIFYLSGYNYPFRFPAMYKNNFYITKNGSPWGMAGWFSKREKTKQYYDLDFLKNLITDQSNYKALKKRRPQSIPAILRMLKTNKVFGDTCLGCYAALEDKYWVLPVVSKVRNQGTDGSGAHATAKDANRIEYYSNQLIDDNMEFEFSNDLFTYSPSELRLDECPQKWYKELVKTLITYIDLFCLRNFGFVPKSKYF